MACVSPDLDLYVLGWLNSAATVALEPHLLICESCRAELNFAVLFARMLRESLPWLDEPDVDPKCGAGCDRAAEREAAWHPEFQRPRQNASAQIRQEPS